MSVWTPVRISLALSLFLRPSQAAPGCRTPPLGALHSDAGDFSGWSPEDSWSWPDSRGPPTTIRLPDGREFWPSDSRSVQDPRELGFEPVDARQMGRFYKRMWDEARDYEERNATKGRRLKALDLHYDLLHNTDLPIEEKAERFHQGAGDLFAAEKNTLSGESLRDKSGDLEKLANVALKALKINKKWFGHWLTEEPYKPRGFTTRNLDINDIYSRYYGRVNWTTRPSSEDLAYEDAFFRTMTEYTTLLPWDADWWVKALDYVSKHPELTTAKDYLEEAFHEWSRFTHPTTEHVSHRTINLTVLFDRRYTKNDTFDYFSLDQFKPKDWTEPVHTEAVINPYELKDVVIARYRNTTTKKLPRANFFYSTYESEYDYNNTYSELNNLDFGHFQGNSSEWGDESIRETPKTYPPHVPTCGHGFPRDSQYDPSEDVSSYDSHMCVHITTRRPTTGEITHNIGFRNDMIKLGTTITVDMDVLLGRNTHRPHKRSTTTTDTPKKRGRSTKAKQPLETCVHGLEVTNDLKDVAALRGVFERIRHVNDTSRAGTYRKRATTSSFVKRNVTRTCKTRRPRTAKISHVVKRAVDEQNDEKICANGEHIRVDKAAMLGRIMGKLNAVVGESGRRKRRAIGALKDKFVVDKKSINAHHDKIISDLRILEAEIAGAKFGDQAQPKLLNDAIRRQRANDVMNHQRLNDLNRQRFGDVIPGGDVKRRKRCPGSEMEYVSRGAKDKAYRSYEDYLKKTKNECQEDRICRHFREEMARVDSFDGMGHWN